MPVFDINQAGQLRLNGHRDAIAGAEDWDAARHIGNEWLGNTLAGPDGRMFEIEGDGLLRVYQWLGNGWERYGEDQAYSRDVQTDLGGYIGEEWRDRITVDSQGAFYFIRSDNTLHRMTLDENLNRSLEIIDTGWLEFDLIAAAGDGVIYARTEVGNLYRYHYDADSQRWLQRRQYMGPGWERYQRVVSPGGDVLYGTDVNTGNLRWRRYLPHSGGAIDHRTVHTGIAWTSNLDTAITSNACEWSVTPSVNRPVVTPIEQPRSTLFESSDGHLQFSFVDRERRLHHGDMPDPTSGTARWTSFLGNTSFNGVPAIGQKGANSRLFILGQQLDSSFRSVSEIGRGAGWTEPAPEGGLTPAAATIAHDSDGNPVAFAVDDTGRLWSSTLTGLTYLSGWREIPVTPALAAEPPTITQLGADLHFVVRTDTGELVENRRRGDTWQNATWTALGKTTSSPPAAVARTDGSVTVFAVEDDGQLSMREAGGDWRVLSGIHVTGPPAATISPWGTLELLARGTDGYIHATGQVAPGSTDFRPWWETSPVESATDPSLISMSGGLLVGSFRDRTGTFYTLAAAAMARTATDDDRVPNYVSTPVHRP
ncbi:MULTISPECIES: tachylectin-related carbohydrate-binding protein [Actinoalloteichus]|uniref:tachylectin-related carbohydrate-binding protein n=1 Tax=Actinoalloteichus TaxID=65496 RepID=UPI0009525CE0|nr:MULTISPECIES: tachylectin-related carbohydrate-binding protein [Actinoalloteichus]